MKQLKASQQIEKTLKINTFKVIRTIEFEQDFNELIMEEQRTKTNIEHLQRELEKHNAQLEEIRDIKKQLGIE
jgi:hypothetical protein